MCRLSSNQVLQFMEEQPPAKKGKVEAAPTSVDALLQHHLSSVTDFLGTNRYMQLAPLSKQWKQLITAQDSKHKRTGTRATVESMALLRAARAQGKQFTGYDMVVAAVQGQEDVVLQLHRWGVQIDDDTFDHFLGHGVSFQATLPMAFALIAAAVSNEEKEMALLFLTQGAVRSRRRDVLLYVLVASNYSDDISKRACRVAAEYGRLDCLQWLQAMDPPVQHMREVVYEAANAGHLNIIKWATQDGTELVVGVDEDEHEDLIAWSALNFGHLHIAEWAWDHGEQLQSDLWDAAVLGQSIAGLNLLHSKKVPLTDSALYMAVFRGVSDDVAQWLMQHNAPVNEETLDYALRYHNRNLTIVAYALSHGITLKNGGMDDEYSIIRYNDDPRRIEVFELLHYYKVPISLPLALNRACRLQQPASAVALANWLLDHNTPIDSGCIVSAFKYATAPQLATRVLQMAMARSITILPAVWIAVAESALSSEEKISIYDMLHIMQPPTEQPDADTLVAAVQPQYRQELREWLVQTRILIYNN